jgi:hypothetical protein
MQLNFIGGSNMKFVQALGDEGLIPQDLNCVGWVFIEPP